MEQMHSGEPLPDGVFLIYAIHTGWSFSVKGCFNAPTKIITE